MTQEAQQVVTPLAALKQLIEDLISMMEYHVEQTRPIHTTTVALQAAREALQEHAMREVQRLGQEIEQEPVGDEWTPCIKLPVIVHVRKQRHGETHVSTREGITPVNLEDLIMRGVSGEEYPIGRAIFEQTYSLDTTPPQQEPVAWEQFYPDIGKPQLTYPPQGIYYTPPQRTWVGLTDEEVKNLCLSVGTEPIEVRLIEAKLKQKNTHD